MLESNPRHLAILRFIREQGAVTRAELVASTGLGMSQVSRMTSQLIDRGLITVERRIGGAEGRPADLLALAGNGRYVIGLDLGGVAQTAVVANLRGEVVGSVGCTRLLTVERDEILRQIGELVEEALGQAGVESAEVLGLGVGLRGVVDPVTGTIVGGPETPGWVPSWIDFPIRDELARVLPWPLVVVDDTVRALGVAEGRYGLGIAGDDFIYVLSDTGIGSAIMIGGRPYIGPNRVAGEIGHITLDPDGDPCGCGKFGCLETFASSTALVKRARLTAGPAMAAMPDLLAAAAAGDPEVSRVLRDGGEALGRGLAALLNLLAPNLVVVGGVPTTSDIYLEAAARVATAQALDRAGRELRLVRSELGPLAGAIGAGTMILDKLFEGEPESGARRARARRQLVRTMGGNDGG
jgi:N-acetylglucosamine repressor